CSIPEGKRGFCLTRENRNGKLYSLIYAAVSSVAVDPIEKKPLFHFYPGSFVYSLGTVGCNFRCKHCQNWNISQAVIDEAYTEDIPPEEAIEATKRYNCKSIAWTYNEPTIWLEYTLDCAELAHKDDIKTVYVTNGYMTEETLELLSPLLDAANIDLKGMTDEFYKNVCSAKLQPVLDSIKWMHDAGVHIEVTNLIIPGYNDSEDELKALVRFMVEEVGVEVPLHFTRFYPHYKMRHLPPTPTETLLKARNLALEEGMRYVYVGNVPGLSEENTYCYNCGELLIQRYGFQINRLNLKKGRCPSCNAKIDIIV
ncbi:MAG: AmmeMemoRadiSam system radical SAM enzyme, partial [Methanobacteriales archaeon]|nr:AmmeMemoRadiSam system radical SAM enzyme [Methanobacteriales archaeon]